MREVCSNALDHYIDRMHILSENEECQNAIALYEEIQEWMIDQDQEVMFMDFTKSS
jgi:hypothetical protein